MSRDLVDAIHDAADSAVDTAGSVLRKAQHRNSSHSTRNRALIAAGLLAALIAIAIVRRRSGRSEHASPKGSTRSSVSSNGRVGKTSTAAEAEADRVGALAD